MIIRSPGKLLRIGVSSVYVFRSDWLSFSAIITRRLAARKVATSAATSEEHPYQYPNKCSSNNKGPEYRTGADHVQQGELKRDWATRSMRHGCDSADAGSNINPSPITFPPGVSPPATVFSLLDGDPSLPALSGSHRDPSFCTPQYLCGSREQQSQEDMINIGSPANLLPVRLGIEYILVLPTEIRF